MNSMGIQPADLNIDLDVTNFDLSEFTRTKELASIGLETTEASIERIRTWFPEGPTFLGLEAFKWFVRVGMDRQNTRS